uniref:Uncharacterized protein n=1 Tax=Babesia bovis TaxID=5865 RepID=S6B6V0_BABBO|nr:hypothetical protein [Babesia bovis]
MCTSRPPVTDKTAVTTPPSNPQKNDSTLASYSVEKSTHSNPLDHVNILSENKFGISLHKMSDFSRPIANISGSGGNDVKVQTDVVTPEEPVPTDNIRSNSKVKVVYAGRDEHFTVFGAIPQITQPTASEIASNIQAEAIVSTIQPRLPEGYMSGRSSPDMDDRRFDLDVRSRREKHRADFATREHEEHERWRARHAPLYAQIRDNERCGYRMSMLCRGGKRGGSRLTHGSSRYAKDDLDNSKVTLPDEDTSLIYESPSKKIRSKAEAVTPQPVTASLPNAEVDDYPRMVRGYYGYDDEPGAEGDSINEVPPEDFFANMYSSSFKSNDRISIQSGCSDPFSDFEGWWNQHSVPLSRLREQLSIS